MLSRRDQVAELAWLAGKASAKQGLGGLWDDIKTGGEKILGDTAKKAGAAGADLLASEIRGSGPGIPKSGGLTLPPVPKSATIAGMPPALVIGGVAAIGLGAVFLLMRRKKS